MTNERTSKGVGKLAAMLLALDDYYLDVWINDDPARARKALRTLAASALTQLADTGRIRPKSDDRGFDPRDGGKIGRAHVPKQRKSKRGRA